MKSLFRCAAALALCLLGADFANAQCSSCGGGFGSRFAARREARSAAPVYSSATVTSGASFCGPCAYAGVPCPQGCSVACVAGCSTGCPGASVTSSDGRTGKYIACPSCPGGVAFVPDPVQLPGRINSTSSTFKTVNGITYKCTGDKCEVVPAVAEGEHVQHPANPAGLFPAGTGVVDKVLPLNKGGKVYTVKCDKTGKTLPVAFEDGELWTH